MVASTRENISDYKLALYYTLNNQSQISFLHCYRAFNGYSKETDNECFWLSLLDITYKSISLNFSYQFRILEVTAAENLQNTDRCMIGRGYF